MTTASRSLWRYGERASRASGYRPATLRGGHDIPLWRLDACILLKLLKIQPIAPPPDARSFGKYLRPCKKNGFAIYTVLELSFQRFLHGA